MADDVTVTNKKSSFDADTNDDFVVDTTEMSDGSHKQHVGIDISTGTTPDRVTSSNPLPVSGSLNIGTVTNVDNVTSVDLVDEVTNVGTVSAVTTVATLDSVASVTTVEAVTKVETCGRVNQVSTVNSVSTVSVCSSTRQPTHDLLNCNANMQVNDADVSSLNPVPVDLAASDSVEVVQTTHDDLNANANIQVSDTDVSDSNPVPTKLADPDALTFTHSTSTVGTSSVAIVASDANTKYVFIQNDSANTVWIKVGGAAVANQGIRLNARGSYYEMTRGAGNISTAQIFAIASAASSNVLVAVGT